MLSAAKQPVNLIIDIRDLTFGYRDQPPIFDRFTWQVQRGEAWAVIGPSGSGKSTLLYLIEGLTRPTSGVIAVAGDSVPRKKERGKTGLVLQDYGLLPWATVWENVTLGVRIRRFYNQETDVRHAEERAAFWLERVGLADQRDKYPNQLSGGQRQRAALARTLAIDPDVLLMDEPFSALDALTREDMQRLTRDLRAETGITMILVTHSIEEAVYLGNPILVLGQPPTRAPHVIANPGMGQAGYRGAADFLAKTVELRAALGAPEADRAVA
ncbi:MAG: ABC transporter ATP-binding protein [Anaerolineae bacterium]